MPLEPERVISNGQGRSLLALAQEASRAGNLTKAASLAEAALESTASNEQRGWIQCELGEVALRRRRRGEARERFDEALDLARDDPLLRARAIRGLGDVWLESGYADRAEEQYSEARRVLALSEAHTPRTQTEQAFLLLRLGTIAQGRMHFQAAEGHFGHAIGLAAELDDPFVEGVCARCHAGVLLELDGQFEWAEAELQSALETLEPLGGVELVQVMLLQGELLESRDLERTLAIYRDAHSIAERIDNPIIARVLRRIGRVHGMMGEYKEALDVFDRAIAIATSTSYGQPDDVELSDLWGDKGEAFAQLNELDPAFEAYKKALSLDQDHRDLLGLARAHRRLGSAYREAGEFARAEESFDEADSLLRQGEDEDERSELAMALGRLAEDRDRLEEAERLYGSAIAYLEEAERSGVRAAEAYCRRASILIKQQRFVEGRAALDVAQSALPGGLESIPTSQIEILLLRSACALGFEENEEARRHAQSALSHAEAIGLDVQKAEALHQLARCYAVQGEREDAMDCLRRAEQIFDDDRDDIALATILLTHAAIFHAQGAAPESRNLYRDALRRAQRKEHDPLIGRASLGLGRLYLEGGLESRFGRREHVPRDLDRAAEYLEEAQRCMSKDLPQYGDLLLELGQLRELEGREGEAVGFYEVARSHFDQIGDPRRVRQCERLLIHAWSASDAGLQDAVNALLTWVSLDDHMTTSAWTFMLQNITPELRDRVVGLFADSEFVAAVRATYVVFEDRLRAIAGTRPTDRTSGIDLWKKASAVLTEADSPAAGGGSWRSALDEGLDLMIKGAFKAGRNPATHTTLEIGDQEAFFWIFFIDTILRWLDEKSPRQHLENA
jgi:tetratricopeptide (TPR) repeat protein